MSRVDVRTILEVIGVSLMARDIQVLGALLKLHGTNTKGHTVEEIRAKVNSEADKKFSKAWIYKCLSNLEEDGFIFVNRIDTPNTYSAGLESIGNALQRHLEQGMINLETSEIELKQEIQFLTDQNTDELAKFLVESATGVGVKRTTRVVEGLQNVRNVIIDEMTLGVKEEDVLRITEKGNILDIEGMQVGDVESSIFKAMDNGLEVRAIFKESPLSEDARESNMAFFLQPKGAAVVRYLMNGRLKVRVGLDSSLTYRMISLNREKMLLFLVDAPKPDSVVLVHYDSNPKLIDDAIDAFDRMWEKAIDITEGFADMFSKLKEGQ